MKHKPLIAAALLSLAATFTVHAQAPSAPASAGKKALVAKLLRLQQPAVENLARLVVEQPAAQMMQQAGIALQRLAAERREAVAQDIQADVRKYVEEALPPVRDRALKLAPTTIGVLLEERFSEDELRQIIAIIESPVNRKFQAMGQEFQQALAGKLGPEIRSTLEPRFRALQQGVAGRLGVTPAAPDSAASR